MDSLGWLFLIGRVLFATIFVFSGLGHFMQLNEMSQYAESKGVPAPKAMVALSGIVILAGGLSILFWTQVVLGAWLLAGFLVLAAIMMHDFWNIEDPQQAQTEQAQFFKNFALAGAAMIFYVIAQTAARPDVVSSIFG
jgi:uncharacterized membrane protein YphA (DoxX/SURF4 family)